ncbi:amino acid adenylation domain-containing protein [Streptomyces sp. NPDC050658]|uniref:non-ribosomal peptide synthetase n=1 Tax=unclassified Streptomyces TaxID=2593676 RepID=UPI0034365EF5
MDRHSAFPLTPLQHGMLLHSMTSPDDGVYVQQKILTLPGAVDQARWRAALRSLCERHPILRTVFHLDDPQDARQEVLSEPMVVASRHDWSGPAGAGRLADFLAQDRAAPLSPAEQPALRFAWGATGEGTTLVWTSHHALMDGRSYAILLQELMHLYEGGTDLPTRRGFSFYVDWLAQQDYSAAARFWRGRLAGAQLPTPLPGTVGSGMRPGRDLSGAIVREIDESATAALVRAAAEHRVTVNTLVLAAWALVLQGHSGRDDVLFGITKSCRGFHPGGADMVGLLMNTLPLRVTIAEGVSTARLLDEVRRRYVELRQVEYTPLRSIADWCGISRGTPLFDSVLVFDNRPAAEQLRALGGAWRHRQFQLEERAHYPLTVTVYQGDRLTVKAGFDRCRIDETTVAMMLADLRTALARLAGPADAVARTASPHSATAGAADVEPVAYPRDRCTSHLFEEQARRRPQAVAVEASDGSMTYRELLEHARRLAAYLRGLGVGPGTLVGVCLPRTTTLPVGLLAVMMTGGAYVPVDPIYPPARIEAMLRDAAVPWVLADGSTRMSLPAAGLRVVDLDAERMLIDESAADPADDADPDRRAYVVYTSGSTGRPKGVVVGHRALTNLLCAMATSPGCAAGDRLLAVTTVCFDIAGLELLLPLVTGASVVIAPAETAADGFALRELLERTHPTIMQATPATWRMLLTAGWVGGPGLRVLCGGEALPPDLARSLVARAGELWNMYGPTETTIWSAVANVGTGEAVTLGRPIANTRFVVLDGQGEPVLDGREGELCIGGEGVAEGYLGQPELTASRFLGDPGAPDRLYRTGDLVRRLPDGRYEFRGRTDRQIKLRGYRVEPGEIEQALREHPAVADAVVAVDATSPDSVRLTAYVVAAPGHQPQPSQLRAWLSARLPAYMVPATATLLEHIPRTLNGKVDLRALPRPDVAPADGRGPRSATERTVAEIWRRLLGVGAVDVEENFFDAGGDSLLLMHMVAALRQLGTQVSGLDAYTYPTIRLLAAFLDAPHGSAPPTTGGRRSTSRLDQRRARLVRGRDGGKSQ